MFNFNVHQCSKFVVHKVILSLFSTCKQETQLKAALLNYVKRYHPEDSDKFDLLAARFGMHRETAEQLEESAYQKVHTIRERLTRKF